MVNKSLLKVIFIIIKNNVILSASFVACSSAWDAKVESPTDSIPVSATSKRHCLKYNFILLLLLLPQVQFGVESPINQCYIKKALNKIQFYLIVTSEHSSRNTCEKYGFWTTQLL